MTPRKAASEVVRMSSGGARNRSGPGADPHSGRSERRGFVLTALPNEGYDGPCPDFPLPPAVVINEYYEGFGKERTLVREKDEGATEDRRAREAELWEWAWRTPQACAWSLERWRWQTVAMWVRTSALCESSDATAADKNSLHRFADQIGLTPAGLKENGWAVAPVEIGYASAPAKPDDEDEEAPVQRRLSAVQGA